jgi:hypothetical protein
VPSLIQKFPRKIRLAACALALLALFWTTACNYDAIVFPAGLQLSSGTWGGENAGMLVNDELAHVHIGCTLGNLPAPVPVDETGHFEISGSYVLRAYPIAIGPELPAQFSGRLGRGKLLLTVTVNDTVEKRTVILGPVQLTYGKEPQMGPCPICRTIQKRANAIIR